MSTRPIDTVLLAVADQHAELDRLLDGLDDSQWATPVPRCPGWTIGDVVLHLTQTDELAAASAAGQFGDANALFDGSKDVDQGADETVQRERGASPRELLARWRAASLAQRDALARTDPTTRLPWVTNRLAPATLATTRLAEAWIHTGDIADALGVDVVAAPDRLRHIAWLAWRTLPYAFERAGTELSGSVAVTLTAPDGATWHFGDSDDATTRVTGPGEQWCLVAARRLDPMETQLRAQGSDADAVLELVRTYA